MFPALRAFLLCSLFAAPALAFTPGETVRLIKGETLAFQGKRVETGFKGQEFTVLKHDPFAPQVFVAYYKEDGTLTAATLPMKQLEAVPPTAWGDLLAGAEAARDGLYAEAQARLARAAQNAKVRTYAQPLQMRLTGLLAAYRQGAAGQQAMVAVAQGMRELAATLASQEMYSLAAAVDGAVDRATAALPPGTAPASKLDRADVERRAKAAAIAMTQGKQAAGFHKLVAANELLQAGLKAEPKRPELAALAAKVKKDLAEADQKFADADRMRKFANGTPHALTALEGGLKICADHPQLRALRKEMESAVEERTAPPLTPALLAKAGGKTPAVLKEGRELYTNRCTECHDLEMLDGRSLGGWEKMVASMAGRAHLDDAQQKRIMDYLAVAWASLEN